MQCDMLCVFCDQGTAAAATLIWSIIGAQDYPFVSTASISLSLLLSNEKYSKSKL